MRSRFGGWGSGISEKLAWRALETVMVFCLFIFVLNGILEQVEFIILCIRNGIKRKLCHKAGQGGVTSPPNTQTHPFQAT